MFSPFCDFAQTTLKQFPKILKTFRDQFRIICGSLVCFSSNFKNKNLVLKIPAFLRNLKRLKNKKNNYFKNKKKIFLFVCLRPNSKNFIFLFVCIQPNSKKFHAYCFIKNKNCVFIILWKIQNLLMGIIPTF